MTKLTTLALVLSSALLFTGCGQKGPLYHPEKAPAPPPADSTSAE